MVIAADYPFLDIVWTMFVFFGWVIWLVLLVRIIGDIFRSDKSGLGKAGWILFVVILPFLGVLVYVIANGRITTNRIHPALPRPDLSLRKMSPMTRISRTSQMTHPKKTSIVQTMSRNG